MAKKILVTGAFGLVGTDLVEALQKKLGKDGVVAQGHSKIPSSFDGVLVQADVRQKEALEKVITDHDVGTIYHLAGLLSAGGEKNPQLAWDVNVNGLKNVLDLGVKHRLKIFWPSSIAAFGPTTPKQNTPQHTVLEPTSMYGVNKVAGELLCQYYFLKYGLDVRSIRYPGLNGWKADPGDGTTEYAIHIFYAAIRENRYTCFLRKDTILPMMYIDDAIKGTLDLMEQDPDKLTVRTSYNFAAINFTPEDLASEITKLSPGFTCTYEPDFHQPIADSWPKSIDDSTARSDWNWKPSFDLPAMTRVMWTNIQAKLKGKI